VKKFLHCGAAAAALLLLSGCGDGIEKLPTVKVAGKLTIDGKPYGPVQLTLTPNPPNEEMPVVTGIVDANGNFSLQTYGEKDGAPVGKYDVSLKPDMLKGGGMVPGIKPATVEIAADSKEITIALEGTGSMVSPLPKPGQEGSATGGAGGGGIFPGSGGGP